MNEKHVKLQSIVAEMKQLSAKNDELLAKGNDMTAEDLVAVEANIPQIKSLKKNADTLADALGLSAEVKSELSGIVNDVETGGDATHLGTRKAGETVVDAESKSVLFQEGECLMDAKTYRAISSHEYKDAFRNYLRKGFNPLPLAEQKTLQEGVDSAGGFMVPPEMLNRIIQRTATPTRVSGLVESFNTSRDSIQMPKVNYSTDDIYTTGIRSTWTGEIPSSSTVHRVTEPVFGQERIEVFTNMMSMPLTNDLVEDSAFPLVSWASGKFQETIDLLKDNMVLNGTGIGQPAGILANVGGTDQPAAVNLGNPISADGILDLAWSLPEQYEENSKFIFNKTSVGKTVAKLKDGDDRYLWGQGLQDSGLNAYGPTARMLAGKPTIFSAFMPSVGAANNVMIYGDPRGYYLVNRIGFSIQVLRELYAETNQILLLGRIRFGGKVVEGWRMKVGVQS